MSLKLVLISPEGTLGKDGSLDTDDMAKLGKVIAQLGAAGIRVAIWSNRSWSVGTGDKKIPLETYLSGKAGVPIEVVGMPKGHPPRQKANSVVPILAQFGVKLEETILVGAQQEDLMAGVNNKLLLLRPAWYGGDLKYGFELKSIEELARFCLVFGTRTHPFYWRIEDQVRGVRVMALGPFSTLIQAFAKFGEDAKQAAKYEAGTLEFWHQLVISTLYFSGLIHQVDYIAVYPGHSKGTKDKAFYEVLSVLGKCFNKSFFIDLFRRHEAAVKSTNLKAADRKFASQVTTVILDRRPAKYGEKPRITPLNLKSRTVLVVDDICTSGRSLDTARAYLKAAGASAVLFAWLKTINTDFLSMDPTPKLKPYDENVMKTEPTAKHYGYAANIVDPAAAGELDDVLKKFQQWKTK